MKKGLLPETRFTVPTSYFCTPYAVPALSGRDDVTITDQTMNGFNFSRISSTSFSLWIFRSIDFERSRLKIPMMDFASMTYLPEIRSKSKSNCVMEFTNDFTLSMEFREICTVFILKTSLEYVFSYSHSTVFPWKSQLIKE